MCQRVLIILLLFTTACLQKRHEQTGEIPGQKDKYTLHGEQNFLTGYPAKNQDGSVNVVVEIPAGSSEKWEVSKSDGTLKWEFTDGLPRMVKYLGYPGNYGMVPQTLLPRAGGGDGDPLDVIVLGPAVQRGSVVQARLVGVLKLLDNGEQDDKLVAVMSGTSFFEMNNLAELNEQFNGVTDIIELWFTNYKGAGKMQSKGFADDLEAERILQAAISAFKHN